MELDTKKIKIMLLDKGWSLAELGRHAGVGNNTVYLVVNNKRGYTVKIINKIAKALGVKPSEIIKENE